LSELERHFELTKPKLIFAQASFIKPIIEVASRSNFAVSNIFSVESWEEEPIPECRDWQTLLIEAEDDAPSTLEDGEPVQDRVAVYAMTSGTTGLPKAAMIPHRYIVAQTSVLEGQFNARAYQVLSSSRHPALGTIHADLFHSHPSSYAYLSFTPSRHPWLLSFPSASESRRISWNDSTSEIFCIPSTDSMSLTHRLFPLSSVPWYNCPSTTIITCAVFDTSFALGRR
jgi:acyl-CoA synthetase (AMP-forming)/AMP-acid ligase II